MATVSDTYIIELERQRQQLVEYLQSVGITISSDATMAVALSKLGQIGQNDYFYQFMSGTMTECRLENPDISSLPVAVPFTPIRNTLTKLYMPYITNIYQLSDNTYSLRNLQHIYGPYITYVGGNYPLGYMPMVKNMVFPKITSVGVNHYGLIAGNGALVNFVCPKLNISGGRMGTNTSVQLIDISFARYTDSGTNTSLKTLILRSTITMSTLVGSPSTYLPSIEAVYVPEVMLNTYKTATNWSAIADKIQKLEGSPYESETWYENTEWYQEEMSVWQ